MAGMQPQQPDGNPARSAAAATGVDGVELAAKMVAAAEAAANAALAEAAAVSQRPATDDSKTWWKFLPKPPEFYHASREAEISAWKE